MQKEQRESYSQQVNMMTAASPPPAATLAQMQEMGINVTHVYGLTEVYGPSVVCAKHESWNKLSIEDQAEKNKRQGVRFASMEGLMVANSETLEPVTKDGQTLGEVFMRGNILFNGYLKNEKATMKDFKGGWFHTGDLGVMHADNYIELKDRSKDIIISGGENISSIEIEDVLYKHPSVQSAAVVAKEDPKWGEVPCAFVELKSGVQEKPDLKAFCGNHLARFKIPKSFVFAEIPKTSTGKIQKFELRNRANALKD